jgi:guanine deaminase
VDDQGRITGAGSADEVRPRFPEAELLDLRPGWIVPGLVDLHTHLPQYGAVAMDGLELLPWLTAHIFPAEERFGDLDVAARLSNVFFRDLLAGGTTTAVVYGSVHAQATHVAFEVAERSGMRILMGKVMMDRHVPEAMMERADAALLDSEDLCRRWHNRDDGRLKYVFSPRFAPACSHELMRGVGDLAAKYSAFIQTHLSESPQEIARVHELFPESANYTDVYRHAGLLGPRTLLGHCIHLDPNERQMIRESGASIVHCPRSNAFLKSGIMPLRRWLNEGLSVGLGTDVGAGPSLSLWAEMAMTCQASKLREALLGEAAAVDPVLAFHLATLGGAKALGMEGQIGSLDGGKDADFIVVDPGRVDPLTNERDAEAPERVLSRLVYRDCPGMVREAYVRGRRCFAQEN